MARSLEDSETVAVATTNDGVKQTLSPGEAALSEIAETCHLKQPWPEVKELLKARIAVNLSNEPADATDKGDTVKDYHDRIIQALDTFHDAPFTIQRLSELAIHPTEHHRSIWKYLRALEKVLFLTVHTARVRFPDTE
ncbi:hypothetical protein DFS34DRAFT_11082 [Phlyctochytrium arcticum]|nr:hypothetical protein DFS34DRAFT_11082 [Phlyctochytrium arcticum]